MLSLDKRDIEILKILSSEARISKVDLANRINLSPSPCWSGCAGWKRPGSSFPIAPRFRCARCCRMSPSL